MLQRVRMEGGDPGGVGRVGVTPSYSSPSRVTVDFQFLANMVCMLRRSESW